MSVKYTRQLNEVRLLHEEYQMKLSFWNKFVIWSYTLGSGLVNSYLITDSYSKDRIMDWFERIIFTYSEVSNNNIDLPAPYANFLEFFDRSKTITVEASESFLKLYIENLQEIIVSAPSLTGTMMVYKASYPYPDLKVGDVPQKPFNSTSFRVDMNYSMFLPAITGCCMHRLQLNKTSKCLFVSPLLSAYPYECEVLLPHGNTFKVIFSGEVELAVPMGSQTLWKTIQEGKLSLGPVYDYNYKNECSREIKKYTLYTSRVM